MADTTGLATQSPDDVVLITVIVIVTYLCIVVLAKAFRAVLKEARNVLCDLDMRLQIKRTGYPEKDEEET